MGKGNNTSREEDPAQRLVTVNYNLPSGPSHIGFPFNFPKGYHSWEESQNRQV